MFGEVKKSCIFETSNKQKHTVMTSANNITKTAENFAWETASTNELQELRAYLLANMDEAQKAMDKIADAQELFTNPRKYIGTEAYQYAMKARNASRYALTHCEQVLRNFHNSMA